FLQRLQASDARADVLDVLVDQRIHVLALILRAVAQGQQAADFIEGHVQAAAITNERQALDVFLCVQPIIALAAGRLSQ
nr:hypothetical protein [Tanacetum cinerariifolium]